jgi:gamma-glutamyltranspeptidase / glutathione hydrolase
LTGRSNTYAQNGIVATPHYLASQAGLSILQDGGNAVDAIIAANAVLNVVYPHQCHIGGDLFAIVWDPASQSLSGLNASGPAPAAESIDRVRSLNHKTMPQRGALSVSVPGTVGGWQQLADRFGRFELGRLLQPAIGYARDGAPMSRLFARAISVNHDLLVRDRGASSLFVHSVLRGGDVFRQPGLASTFDLVATHGPDGFYSGPVAEDIVSTLQSLGSAMSHEDLHGYAPEWVTPISTPYRDIELLEMPANTQGPAALLLANIVEGWPVAEFGHTTAQGVHAYVEAKHHAWAERDTHIADPRFHDVPEERFLDKDLARMYRESIDLERASNPGARASEDGDTVYLCAVDRDGMAVSLIQSVYNNFGSGVVASRSGVLFQNRASAFSLDPNDANSLQPGKRPRHTLIPAMLLRDGVPEVVFGTMGADGQAQTHLQLLVGMVDFGLEPQDAIEAPRWRSTVDPDGRVWVLVDHHMDVETIEDLQRRGHEIVSGELWDSGLGHAQAIRIDRERGILIGGADPRGDGVAAGW